MIFPQLAMCNFVSDVTELKRFAKHHGFAGIDWTITHDDMPVGVREEKAFVKKMEFLSPLEVRYHLYLKNVEIGNPDSRAAVKDMVDIMRAIRLVGLCGGRCITGHIGLMKERIRPVSWQRTLEDLLELVRYAKSLGIRLCLENLPWGWTSRPNLFEKILRKTGCWGTIDIGHATASECVRHFVYEIADFVTPHPHRFLNAHIYHQELDNSHIPPGCVDDLFDRLNLLLSLPLCNWWVLEMRSEEGVLQTLRVVQDFLSLQDVSRQGMQA